MCCMYVDTFCEEYIMLVARDKYWDFNETGMMITLAKYEYDSGTCVQRN